MTKRPNKLAPARWMQSLAGRAAFPFQRLDRTQERTSHKSHGTRGVPEVTPSEGFDTAISMPCRITNLDVLSPVEGVIGRFIGRRVRAALTGRCANAEGAVACRRRQRMRSMRPAPDRGLCNSTGESTVTNAARATQQASRTARALG